MRKFTVLMDSRRQQKIAHLINEVFSEFLIKEGRNYYGNAFVTVTGVKITPDLNTARIYLSIFSHPQPQVIISFMNENSSELRGKFGNLMRHDLRKIPELEFFLDDSMEQAEKINQIFKDLKTPG